MCRNRVIGAGGTIPWHLPEDFCWFKKMTAGHAVLMGRKTFESLGKPLPNRRNFVVTRRPEPIAGVTLIPDLANFDERTFAEEVWVIGGAEIYRQLLPRCSDLFLSEIAGEYAGDTFFPPFEDEFTLHATPLVLEEFTVRHYTRRLS